MSLGGLASGHANPEGMTDHEASRTLVKSPPELWAECSDAASLARHLGEFGEIKITRLEPETTVAWEGERASGTVRIEPSAWGTKVTLTAQTEGDGAVEDPASVEQPLAPDPPVPEPPAEAGNAVRDESDAGDEATRPASDGDSGPTVVEVPPPAASPRRGLLARLRERWRAAGASVAIANTVPPPPAAIEPEPEPEPVVVEPEPEPVAVEPEPEPESEAVEPEPQPEASPDVASGLDATAVLAAALDSLGQAHHRPFSRA